MQRLWPEILEVRGRVQPHEGPPDAAASEDFAVTEDAGRPRHRDPPLGFVIEVEFQVERKSVKQDEKKDENRDPRRPRRT